MAQACRVGSFFHRGTVCFKPPATLVVDSKIILGALKVPKDELVGLVPLYGGKCFDITLHSSETAAHLATEGFDLTGVHHTLNLLGTRSIHVSVFVSVEFPDEIQLNTLATNVALLRDIACYASEINLPLAILSLDQEKAFDRVDWDFLLTVLQRMGIGLSFVNWVKLLYTDICSPIIINGYTSYSFKPSRGVREGCPLSPLLYALSIEVLAVDLGAHPDIVGLQQPGIASTLPALFHFYV